MVYGRDTVPVVAQFYKPSNTTGGPHNVWLINILMRKLIKHVLIAKHLSMVTMALTSAMSASWFVAHLLIIDNQNNI
jgi:hypothetical protein